MREIYKRGTRFFAFRDWATFQERLEITELDKDGHNRAK